MENFFRHLKEEMFRDVRFISTEALATHIDDYIHYHKTRRDSTNLKGPEPSSIPDPGPRGLGFYFGQSNFRSPIHDGSRALRGANECSCLTSCRDWFRPSCSCLRPRRPWAGGFRRHH
ncbi:IS3 family transposase [Arthrobacter sp. M2012083]|uniref:IS3 family transposase n=1 Tax=Arthrobacter sp. M2012083 TaxID=1197706 RepID=UPI003369E134